MEVVGRRRFERIQALGRFVVGLISVWAATGVGLLLSWRLRSYRLALAVVVALALAVTAGGLLQKRTNDRLLSTDSGYEDLLERLLKTRYLEAASPLPENVGVRTLATDVGFPVSMTFTPQGDIAFVGDRGGDVSVIEGDDGPRLCGSVPALGEGGGGLLGVEASPSFEEDRSLYVYYTDSELRENKIVRMVVDDQLSCRVADEVLTGVPASDDPQLQHNGGQMAFVGGDLFVTTGDAQDPPRAQDQGDLAGKVLRIEPDGGLPTGNPLEGATWAYGFRNPYGLTEGPQGTLWVTDNGPFCTDELNHVTPGSNHGWGAEGVDLCVADPGSTTMQAPELTWNPTVAPTDLDLYDGPIRQLRGLLVGDYNYGFLHRIELSADGSEVVAEDVFRLREGLGIIDVESAPDGSIFLVGIDRNREDPGVILYLEEKVSSGRAS